MRVLRNKVINLMINAAERCTNQADLTGNGETGMVHALVRANGTSSGETLQRDPASDKSASPSEPVAGLITINPARKRAPHPPCGALCRPRPRRRQTTPASSLSGVSGWTPTAGFGWA
ncbi:hypothetical protein GCM10009759_27780 [Kitasatospora saccharophila]|uniref:Uncharacterized protein n=1 Tax=Kitasatospora saccharophila TaxID=407973 RepID=A0ABP5IF66_9ACTN